MKKHLLFIFSSVGHAYIHMFTAFYFVIVLSLEREWQLPYHELITLWTPGALLVGLGALPAGWLSDRWSGPGMLIIFFLGMGFSAVAAAFSPDSMTLMLALAGIGLFAAIYHPVGIPLVIRTSANNPGKALAVNGLFGGLGAALAGLTSGYLLDLGGRQLAFLMPGLLAIATGLAMWFTIGTGPLQARPKVPHSTTTAEARRRWLWSFATLLFCMFLGGLIYHSTQGALPKVFALRLSGKNGVDVGRVGYYVALVYVIAAVFQFVGGILADRFVLRNVYRVSFLLQIPLLLLAANAQGLVLVVVASAMVSVAIAALPAENIMLSKLAPDQHHGVAFAAKFVLSFGVAPIAVLLVSQVNAMTDELVWVFRVLAVAAMLVLLVASRLPVTTK